MEFKEPYLCALCLHLPIRLQKARRGGHLLPPLFPSINTLRTPHAGHRSRLTSIAASGQYTPPFGLLQRGHHSTHQRVLEQQQEETYAVDETEHAMQQPEQSITQVFDHGLVDNIVEARHDACAQNVFLPGRDVSVGSNRCLVVRSTYLLILLLCSLG